MKPSTIFFQQLGIKILTVSVTNHKYLLAKYGIKILLNIFMKNLSGLVHDWDNFLGLAMLNYSSCTSPCVDG